MKSLALLGSGLLLVAAVAQTEQAVQLPEPLAGDFTKLSSAKTLKVHLTKRIVGESPTTYTLELTKDKKFKLTYDDGFVLSDGTNIYTYDKAKNSYSQVPVTDGAIAKFQRRVEVFGWEAFLQAKPGSDLASATPGEDKTVQGKALKSVAVTVKPDQHDATILIDPDTGVTKAFTVKMKDKEYLVTADTVDLASTFGDDEFAFVSPAGATMAKADDGNFANVSAILTAQCMPCHDGGHKRAGVDVSTYDGIKAIVTPGMSGGSLLIKAVKGDGVDLMPKGRAPLTDDQISALTKWIDAGAKNE